MARKLLTIFLALILVMTMAVGCSSGGKDTSSDRQDNQNAASGDKGNDGKDNGGKTESGNKDGDSASSKDLKIAWVHSNAAANSEQRAKTGFKEYIKGKGWNWEVSELDSGGSGEATAKNLEDAVQKGVDAIIVSMADMRACKAALEDAKKAGIPVFSVDSGWTEGIVADVTSNNYLMSAKISSYLVDRLGGEGNIVAFKMAEHHGVRKRGETLDVILSESPGITLLEDHNIDYTNFYDDVLKTMEDYLAKHGNEIKAVWAGWDEPAMAAAAAIEAAGYSRDDIFVVGIDGHPPAIDEMRNGSPVVATVAQGFEVMGEKIADMIQKIVVDGVSIEEAVPSTTVYVDTPLITQYNLPGEGEPAYLAPDFYSGQ